MIGINHNSVGFGVVPDEKDLARRVIVPLDPILADHVGRHLRPSDRDEVAAMTPRGMTLQGVCAWQAVIAKIGVAITHRGLPAACVGAVELRPGVFEVFMFGTDAWPNVAITATRWVRRMLIPALYLAGAHRAQAASLATHISAHRWLGYLGASIESEMPGFGGNGETFLQFVWLREAVEAALLKDVGA